MTELSEIEKAALNLPTGQRVWLAQSLLDSLPLTPEDLSEAAEVEEAQRREREIESGHAQPIDEVELWRRVEARRHV
jgi:hypothetical protein